MPPIWCTAFSTTVNIMYACMFVCVRLWVLYVHENGLHFHYVLVPIHILYRHAMANVSRCPDYGNKKGDWEDLPHFEFPFLFSFYFIYFLLLLLFIKTGFPLGIPLFNSFKFSSVTFRTCFFPSSSSSSSSRSRSLNTDTNSKHINKQIRTTSKTIDWVV